MKLLWLEPTRGWNKLLPGTSPWLEQAAGWNNPQLKKKHALTGETLPGTSLGLEKAVGWNKILAGNSSWLDTEVPEAFMLSTLPRCSTLHLTLIESTFSCYRFF